MNELTPAASAWPQSTAVLRCASASASASASAKARLCYSIL